MSCGRLSTRWPSSRPTPYWCRLSGIDELATLARAGFDGVILSWAKFVEQMREFQEVTYPLVVQAGLR